MRILILIVALTGALLFSKVGEAETKVTVLSYYNAPPFHTHHSEDKHDHSEDQGLVVDLIKALDRASLEFSFEIKVISRPQLNHIIRDKKEICLIPLTHPLWFDDAHRQKYQWSLPLYDDYDALISSSQDKIEFEGSHTFLSQKIAVPSGFSIYLLDDLIKEGKAQRLDFPSMQTIIKRVADGYVKMGVVPFAVGSHLVKTAKLEDQVYFSKRHQQTYKRFMMFRNASEEQLNTLNQAIRQIQQDGTLKKILEKYGY